MKANKLKYLSSGNILFSNWNGIDDVSIKGFMDVTGADMLEGDLIRVARQNGSDFYTFNYRDIKYLEGQSGVLSLPTSKQAFYTILFTEFIIPQLATLPAGAATAALQQQILDRLNELASKDENQPVFNENDYFSSVALGKITNAINFKKAGGNPVVGTTKNAIKWENTPLNLITTASTISFVSDNGADKISGTGAQKILITGVDADFTEQSEVLDMNGTTPVTTAKRYFAVLNRVQVYQAGTSQVNVGNIKGTVSGNNVCTMPAGVGLMKQLCYAVPKGKKSLIHGFSFDVSKNIASSQKIDVFFYALVGNVKFEIFTIRIDQSTGSDVFISKPFKTPLVFDSKTVWWFEAKTDSGTAWIDGEAEQTVHNN